MPLQPTTVDIALSCWTKRSDHMVMPTLETCGNFCPLLTTFGNFCHLLSTFGNLLQLLAIFFAICQQLLATLDNFCHVLVTFGILYATFHAFCHSLQISKTNFGDFFFCNRHEVFAILFKLCPPFETFDIRWQF